MADARILPQEKLESIAYACEQVRQRGSNNVVEVQWRRRALLLLAHINALQDKLTVAEARVAAHTNGLKPALASGETAEQISKGE